MKHFSHDLPHYLTLFGILGFGLLAFIIFSYDRLFQMGVGVALAAGYVTWGIVHHLIHKDLHLAVILEYLAVAGLGLVIVFTLVFRV